MKEIFELIGILVLLYVSGVLCIIGIMLAIAFFGKIDIRPEGWVKIIKKKMKT